MYYIGIDLGTSAVKLLLMDETGNIANIVSREYPIAFPHPGWSEQDPADWWAAVCDGIPRCWTGLMRLRSRASARAARCTGWWCWTKMTRLSAPASFGTMAAPKAGRLLKRCYRQGQAEPLHRKHRLCRLHRAQTALDAGERNRTTSPASKNHAAEGLHQL